MTFNPGPSSGSAVSAYRATCTPVTTGVTRVGVRFASPVQVLGLLTGHAYKCSVVATNARGTQPGVQRLACDRRHARGAAAVSRRCGSRTAWCSRSTRRPTTAGRSSTTAANCTSPNGGAAEQPACSWPARSSPPTSRRAGHTRAPSPRSTPEASGAPATTRPIVISGLAADRASPTATAAPGCLVSTPGLQLAVAQTHTFALAATLGAVHRAVRAAAKLSLSFRTTAAISCETAIRHRQQRVGDPDVDRARRAGRSRAPRSSSPSTPARATPRRPASTGRSLRRTTCSPSAHIGGGRPEPGHRRRSIGRRLPGVGADGTFAVTAVDDDRLVSIR